MTPDVTAPGAALVVAAYGIPIAAALGVAAVLAVVSAAGLALTALGGAALTDRRPPVDAPPGYPEEPQP